MPNHVVLVVGATGQLGLEITKQLCLNGDKVRAVVRSTASPQHRRQLLALGVELVEADLKNHASIVVACNGITSVISTASATLSRQPSDSIEAVDEAGQLSLIEAAEQHSVVRFVYVSFAELALSFALQSAKRKVETRLARSRLSHIVLRPTFFQEVWLSSALGFDLFGDQVRVFGDGQAPVNWISVRDVAAVAVTALHDHRFSNQTLPLGGPEALTQMQVVKLAEQLRGTQLRVHHVSDALLRERFRTAANSTEQALAALMLGVSMGRVVQPCAPPDLLPRALISVHDYLSRMFRPLRKDGFSDESGQQT